MRIGASQKPAEGKAAESAIQDHRHLLRRCPDAITLPDQRYPQHGLAMVSGKPTFGGVDNEGLTKMFDIYLHELVCRVDIGT